MATTAKKKINKSKLIRETKAARPELGPQEMSALFAKEPGVDVSPAMISTILSQDRIRKGKRGKRGRPKGSMGRGKRPLDGAVDVTVDNLIKAKALAEKMGGISEAKAALDALSRIIS